MCPLLNPAFSMNASYVGTSFRRITTYLFFVLYFLYFILCNRYLIIYHEQIQLFRFDGNYFKDFLSGPGGLMRYTGAFLTQFYLFPLAGASIVTLAGLSIYSITMFIFRKHRVMGVLPAFVPVLLMAAMHSHYLYTLAYTIGLIVALGYFALYISILNNKLRYVFGVFGWPLLYFLTGGYALVSMLLCFLHELLFNPNRSRLLITPVFPILALLVPYFSSHHIFYIKTTSAWTLFLPLFIGPPVRYILISLLVYYPLVLILSKVLLTYLKRDLISIPWNLKTIITGTLLIVCLAGWILKYVYDRKTEIWLGMDNCVQRSDWEGALKLSSAYPGTNRLVMYFTNLALYKSGHMGDYLFHYPQAGLSGLWLNWERNGISPFFGGEIYYQLAYTSEAYRWAFESMVAKGPNPRSLKRLVITSLVNGDIALAEKYLKVLEQSLFYRQWAQHYHVYVNHPENISEDKDLAEKIHLEIHTDFMSSRDEFDIRLQQLLDNHPDNRMAFEYIMASMLLEKNLSGFAANIYRLKELGYKSIPVHYEEAILAYMSYTKKDIIPEGYSISMATQNLFSEYAKMFFSLGGNPDKAARVMYSKFGKTYWYYLKFINNQAQQKNAKKNK
jgi:hypothetical protein